MTYPPLPHIPVDPQELRPRRFWYAIGGCVIVLGVLAGLGLLVAGVMTGLRNLPEQRQQFRAGEQVALRLSEGERLAIYTSVPGTRAECRAVGNTSGIAVSTPTYSFEYSRGGSSWAVLYEVQAAKSGRYTLTCAGGGSTFALGEPPQMGRFFATIFGTILAVIVVPMLGALVGGGVVLAVAVGRNGHRKRIQAQRSPPWYPPPV